MKIIVTSAERDAIHGDDKALDAVRYLHEALGTGEDNSPLWVYPDHVTATHTSKSDRPVINGHEHVPSSDGNGQEPKPRGVGHTTGVHNPS